MKPTLRLLLLGCLLPNFTAHAQPYCTPSYVVGSTDGDYIDGFAVGDISNISSGPSGATAYTDHSYTGPGFSTRLAPGGTYPVTITAGPYDPVGLASEHYAIWIDLDRSGTFDIGEQLVLTATVDPGEVIVVPLEIPTTAVAGYTLLRVICALDEIPLDPCGSYSFGETEDYTVVIDDGSPCIPVYSYGSVGGDYIDGFVLGTITNFGSGGGTASAPYSNYRNSGPGFITSVAPGGTYSATITSGPGPVGDSYAIWVDLDHDLAYEPNELLVQGVADDNDGVTQLDLPIPADALLGYTSLRVVCTHDESISDPCGTYELGETEDYTVVIDDGAPCIPVYLYGTTQEDYIEDVIVGTINNSASGPGSTPYSDLTHAGPNSITSLTPDVNTLVIITTGTHYSTEDQPNYYSVWVDLDQNGSFAFTERLALTSSYYPGEVLLSNLVIPTGTPNGYTRMRVMCTFDTIPIDACDTYLFGETEDYTVVIDDGQTCIPLYAAQASQGNYVTDVQLEGMHWTSPNAPASGYTDATEFAAHLQAGVPSLLHITGGPLTTPGTYVWIDWNGDGFDAGDLLTFLLQGVEFEEYTIEVTPPADMFGYARMRVSSVSEEVGPCDPAAAGSAVDFGLAVDHSGWPCLPLLGYGTQLGDGFANLSVQGVAQATQTAFPYYASSASTPYHWERGSSYGVSFEAGAYVPETYRVCMDMNDDGDFSDMNEVLATSSSASAGQLMAIGFTIPANCPPGQHFMRLRANDDANYPLVDPCDDKLYGQIFDWVVAVEDPNGPCIPFVNAWTTGGDFIDGVQLGTIENMSTGGAFTAAYRDYTAQYADLMVGQAAPLFITSGANGGNSYSAWIDYNNDNDFDDTDELLGWIGIADPYATELLIFNVPPGTSLGPKRMRVRCTPTGISDACVSTPIGETEDYTVNINVNTGVLAATMADLHLLPTTDGVQLLTPASLIGHSYLLLDATGRTLSTGRITADRTYLPMTDFARGAYTVQVTNGDARQVKRFVW